MQPDPRRTAILVLLACGGFGFVGGGLGESFVVFVLPISERFGWDRASVVSIWSLAVLTEAFAAPLAGRLFDRLGPRAVYVLGFALIGGGLLLAAQADRVWQLQLCLGVIAGLGGACAGTTPNAAMVGRWFIDRTALAMALLFSAGGLGMLLLVPLAQILVDAAGLAGAFSILGAGALAMTLPALLLPWARWSKGHPAWVSPHAAAGAPAEGWTFARAVRHPGFWGLSVVTCLTSLGISAVTVQVVAYLAESGFARLQAASAWGMTGMLMPIGMIGFGWLDGKIGRRPSVLLSYALSLVGIALLWLLARYPSGGLLALFVLVFGLSYGSRGPLLWAIAVGLFRGGSVASIFGGIGLAGGLGAALGVWLAGLLRDGSGGYDAGLGLAFASLVAGMLPLLTVAALKR